MTHNIREISRVREYNGYWIVEILSGATGRWIVQGEWITKEAAELDRKNWI